MGGLPPPPLLQLAIPKFLTNFTIIIVSGVARGGPGGARPHLIVLVPRLTFKYEKFLILIA